jgi:hypothetical protein
MTIDDKLLKKAQSAASDLAEAERKVLLARAEYHTHIRRLHLAGGSLREIAEALAMSHQRVQQIVEAAGGSWWQRVWRTRKAGRDAVCTFCDRPPSEVSKLIAGPAVFICDSCVAQAEKQSGSFAPARAGFRGRCSFCAKKGTSRRSIIAHTKGFVCEECLRICREILDGRAV